MEGGLNQATAASECAPSFACECIALLSRMPLDWQRNDHQPFSLDVNKTQRSLLVSGRAALLARQAAWYGSQSAETPPHTPHRATFATCNSASELCAASSPDNATQSPNTAAKRPWSVRNLQAPSSAAEERPPAARASDVAVAAPESLIAGGTRGLFPKYNVSDLDSRTLASLYEFGCEPRLPDIGCGDSKAAQQRRPDTSVPGLFLGDLFVSAVSR